MKINLQLFSMLSLCAALAGCAKKNVISDADPSKANGINSGLDVRQKLNGTPGAITYYVSINTGNDSWDGSSPTHGSGNVGPFRTINKAAAISAPGNTISILPGNYGFETGLSNGSVVKIGVSGTAGNYITYKAYDPSNKPVIFSLAADNVYHTLAIGADYIKVQNIEVKGDLANSNPGSGPNDDGKYNTNGISIGGLGGTTPQTPKYVVITGCIVHDVPGGGIAAKEVDNMDFENNVVYNTSYYTKYGTSGISILRPLNIGGPDGDVTTPKNIIRNNVSYNNKTIKSTTDGNGIIVDVNNGFVEGSVTYDSYRGFTRVENNICYGNGGAGIQLTRCSNVNVVNNTTFNNGQNKTTGELAFYKALNIGAYSNIFYCKSGGRCSFTNDPANIPPSLDLNYNTYYNGAPYNSSSNNYSYELELADAHPRYGNANLFAGGALPTAGNTASSVNVFKLSSTSPAVNTGWGSTPHYSYFDFENVQRPKVSGTYVDCGAFESF